MRDRNICKYYSYCVLSPTFIMEKNYAKSQVENSENKWKIFPS